MKKFIKKIAEWFNTTCVMTADEIIFMEMCKLS